MPVTTWPPIILSRFTGLLFGENYCLQCGENNQNRNKMEEEIRDSATEEIFECTVV